MLDGVLTRSALAELRRFCLESAIWHGVSSRVPYIDSQLDGGFCCGLLFQVAREASNEFAHPLRNKSLHWIAGFRYPHPSDGIALHADRSLITANLWITPDEANLDPSRGGMVLYPWQAKRLVISGTCTRKCSEKNHGKRREKGFASPIGAIAWCSFAFESVITARSKISVRRRFPKPTNRQPISLFFSGARGR